MALILFDDFAGYTTAQAGRVWTSITGSGTFATTGGRFNDSYYQTVGNDSTYVAKSFANTSTLVVGMAFYIVDAPPSNIVICQMMNNAVVQSALVLGADLKLRIMRGTSTSIAGNTSSSALSEGVWHYVEWKMTIANSIGSNTCQVNVDEIQWINVTAGEDTQNDTTADISQVQIGAWTSGIGGIQYRLSHIYIDNGTSFYGDSRVETLTVTGNGTTQQFSSSGGSHYPDVDDATPDDDSTYVQSSNVGDIETFQMSNLSASPSTIHALAVWNCIRKTDGGNRTAAAVVRSGSTNYVQSNIAVSDGYHYNPTILTQDPDTAAAWTVSGVNAHEAGLKVIA